MKIITLSIMLFLLIGCKKNVEIKKNYAFSLSYTIDDVSHDFDKQDEQTFPLYRRFGAFNQSSITSFTNNPNVLRFRSQFYEHPLRGERIGFEYRVAKDSSLLDTLYRRYRNYDDFKNVFTLGECQFSDAWNKEGIAISYIKDGELWVSERVYGNNQPILTHSNFYNNSFYIKDIEKFYYNLQSEDAVRIFADFKATLYNENGDSLRIENGAFVMLFSQGN